jgi:D-beta-D-heptose 7-phosphate kinase/D-beta-D-heptose 1-phosphate adenosyltransferase
MGAVGDDPEADQLLGILGDAGLDAGAVLRCPGTPTTVKTRVVARGQQVVRIDREERRELDAEQIEQAAQLIADRLPSLDAIILQDYGKGFINQALVDRIAELTEAPGALVVTVDPNPNNAITWRSATAIKPNRHEAFRFADLNETPITDPPNDDPTLRGIAETLFSKWETSQLLITLGEQGMVMCDRDTREFIHIPPRAHEVFDVSGAGDTAIALFTLGLAADCDPVEAAEISNWASAVVVGKIGTATLTPEELLDATAPD